MADDGVQDGVVFLCKNGPSFGVFLGTYPESSPPKVLIWTLVRAIMASFPGNPYLFWGNALNMHPDIQALGRHVCGMTRRMGP